MKKIYSALAIAVALSASAQDAKVFKGIPAEKNNRFAENEIAVSPRSQQQRIPSLQPVITRDDVCQYYEFSYVDLYEETTDHAKAVFHIEPGTTANAVTLVDFPTEGIDVEATVDLYNSTISIACPQFLFNNTFYNKDVYFYNFTVDASYNIVEATGAMVLNFTKDTGVLAFDPYCIPGVCLEGTIQGWFLGMDCSAKVVDNPYTGATGWTTIGSGTFVDGWMMPGFGVNPAEYPWDVTVQQQDADNNLYRIVNPYAGTECPIAEYNDDTTGEGFIIFSLEVPGCVPVMTHIYCGYTDQGDKMYPFNAAGLFTYDYGYPLADVKGYIENGDIKWQSGALMKLSTYDAATRTVSFNECYFGITGKETSYYSWQTEAGESIEGVGSLVVPDPAGVTDVTVSNEGAPVEYYNLQGVRVAEPTNGIYIRRQGTEAMKVCVVR